MKQLVVLGAGESGIGTALLAIEKGFNVFVSDYGNIKSKYKDVLINYEIEWEEGKHTSSKILKADLVMKSPGISDCVPIIKKILSNKIPVISEIEFASKFTSSKIIGITGSNGKTTTTMMVHQILKDAEIDVLMAGNIGDSFAKEIKNNPEFFVLELSSFQLDGIKYFRPNIAIITNITPDHLDRYDNNFENYIESKFRIVMNQTNSDYLIYNADDPAIISFLKSNKIQSQLIPFSINKTFDFGTYYKDDNIIIKLKNKSILMPTSNLALEGKHNIKNAMAAATVANLLKIRKDTIRESLECFQGAEHRLENVLTINKVRYINDSKATNINATYYALESMESPTVWIVGGIDKGNDYTELSKVVSKRVKAIICLGTNNIKIMDHFENMVEYITEVSTMKDAVNAAYKISSSGDSVLLSPACASFDLFEDFEDRGRQFKEAVRKL